MLETGVVRASLTLIDEAILMKKTHYTIFNIKKKKITLSYPKSGTMRFFQETQGRVRSSRGKRAISARVTEALLYMYNNIIAR